MNKSITSEAFAAHLDKEIRKTNLYYNVLAVALFMAAIALAVLSYYTFFHNSVST